MSPRENIKIIGQIIVNVLYKDRLFVLRWVLINDKTKFTPLLGILLVECFNPIWRNFIEMKYIKNLVEQNKQVAVKSQVTRKVSKSVEINN